MELWLDQRSGKWPLRQLDTQLEEMALSGEGKLKTLGGYLLGSSSSQQ